MLLPWRNKNSLNAYGPEYPLRLLQPSKENCCVLRPLKPCWETNSLTIVFAVFCSNSIEELSRRKDSQRGGPFMPAKQRPVLSTYLLRGETGTANLKHEAGVFCSLLTDRKTTEERYQVRKVITKMRGHRYCIFTDKPVAFLPSFPLRHRSWLPHTVEQRRTWELE